MYILQSVLIDNDTYEELEDVNNTVINDTTKIEKKKDEEKSKSCGTRGKRRRR